jgi:hypothetical protein
MIQIFSQVRPTRIRSGSSRPWKLLTKHTASSLKLRATWEATSSMVGISYQTSSRSKFLRLNILSSNKYQPYDCTTTRFDRPLYTLTPEIANLSTEIHYRGSTFGLTIRKQCPGDVSLSWGTSIYKPPKSFHSLVRRLHIHLELTLRQSRILGRVATRGYGLGNVRHIRVQVTRRGEVSANGDTGRILIFEMREFEGESDSVHVILENEMEFACASELEFKNLTRVLNQAGNEDQVR